MAASRADASAPPPPLGLIAGRGRLPVLEAEGMRAAGREVVALSLAGQADPQLAALCREVRTVSPLRVGAWVRQLRARGVHQAVMVGYVDKGLMYNWRGIAAQIPDVATARLWLGKLRHDRRSQFLLSTLCDFLAERGLHLMDTTQWIPEHLATAGAMGRLTPTAAQLADIAFALPILEQLNKLDVGQGLCVRGLEVVALEAMEGTDRMIARAGELCRGKGAWTLLKGCHAQKDRRFDVPTVGVPTLEKLAAAGAGCLAVSAGRTILVDKPAVIAAADRLGLALWGVA